LPKITYHRLNTNLKQEKTVICLLFNLCSW